MGRDILKIEGETRAVTKEELMNAWLKWLRDAQKARTTLTTYHQGLDWFAKWLEASPHAGNITPKVILEFRNDLQDEGYSTATVNVTLSAVRSFGRFMVQTERWPYNPAAEVEGLREPRGHRRNAMTEEEMQRLVTSAYGGSLKDRRDRAILAFMCYGALRVVEISRAKITHLDEKDGRRGLYIYGKGRPGPEPNEPFVLPDAAIYALDAWLAVHPNPEPGAYLFCSLSPKSYGQRLVPGSVTDIVTARMRSVGINGDKISPHSIRHSIATSWIKHGKDIRRLQKLLRHASLETTTQYIHEVRRWSMPPEDEITWW